MSDHAEREVVLIIPIHPDMELAAARTASTLAELMDFEQRYIEEIQISIIETCINAFEHSKSADNQVVITFKMRDDELELAIADHGVGFQVDGSVSSKMQQSRNTEMQKRGWGLEIIRHMMDSVKVESSETGTTVTMIKKKTPKVDSVG